MPVSVFVPAGWVTVCSGSRTAAACAASVPTDETGAPAHIADCTESWTASICAVNDCARERATCSAIDESTLARTVIGRPCPEVTASENPLGMTNAAPSSPFLTSARASASLVTGFTVSRSARSGPVRNDVNPVATGPLSRSTTATLAWNAPVDPKATLISQATATGAIKPSTMADRSRSRCRRSLRAMASTARMSHSRNAVPVR